MIISCVPETAWSPDKTKVNAFNVVLFFKKVICITKLLGFLLSSSLCLPMGHLLSRKKIITFVGHLLSAEYL